MADPRMRAAIQQVDALLQNATERGETSGGNFSGLPGLVATVTLGQQQVWFSSYGLRDMRDKASGKPTPDDLVWIASITKTFTSALLHILRDEGVVALEDNVSKHFPPGSFGYRSPWATAKPMTLGQLASHTSGLPRETPYYICDADPACKTNSTERERRILSAVAEQWLVVKPSTRFHYSNLGFALLGRALGHAAGASYESLVM
jgi:CubicO group peptidase (beta-lactamase class C family)